MKSVLNGPNGQLFALLSMSGAAGCDATAKLANDHRDEDLDGFRRLRQRSASANLRPTWPSRPTHSAPPPRAPSPPTNRSSARARNPSSVRSRCRNRQQEGGRAPNGRARLAIRAGVAPPFILVSKRPVPRGAGFSHVAPCRRCNLKNQRREKIGDTHHGPVPADGPAPAGFSVRRLRLPRLRCGPSAKSLMLRSHQSGARTSQSCAADPVTGPRWARPPTEPKTGRTPGCRRTTCCSSENFRSMCAPAVFL